MSKAKERREAEQILKRAQGEVEAVEVRRMIRFGEFFIGFPLRFEGLEPLRPTAAPSPRQLRACSRPRCDILRWLVEWNLLAF